LKKQPKEEAPKGGIFQFVVNGGVPTNWTIDLSTNPGSVKKAKAANPDVSFIIEDEHLMKIKNGKLDIQTAFIQGRLKIEGDFTLAMKLGKILGKMMREEG
jgi:putative sterol carrier protein